MDKKNKMISFGDLSINLNAHEDSNSSFPASYESDLSGSSALISAVTSVLGEEVQCIGKVGDDHLGEQVIEVLLSFGVQCDTVEKVPHKRTALTINRGKESVSYRKDSASGLLTPDDVHPGYFKKGDVLFYSSDVMIENSSRSALEKGLKLANQNGTMIVYAPLIHSENWINDKIARETIMHTLPHTHFLILTERELQFLTELKEEYLAVKKLFAGKMKGIIILKPSNRLSYVTAMDKGRVAVEGLEPGDHTVVNEIFIGSFIAQWLDNGYSIEMIHKILADPDLLESHLEAGLKIASEAGGTTGAAAAIKALNL